MSPATFKLALRLRLATTASAAVGLIAIMIVVGALFPAVGHSIGKLDLPQGVATLLGGADYATVTGWYRSEIGAVYGPLVIAAVAIVAAAGSTAGEEEERILGLVLAHPVSRSQLVLGKAAAVAVNVLIIAMATLLGLIAGVAVAGGGVGLGNMVALALHLAAFGLALGALALAVAAGSGRRALASGVAAGFAIVGYLINGFAPLVGAIDWLKYLSPFYYYASHDPLGHGLDAGNLVVLAAFAAAMIGFAIAGIRRRDLRG